MVIVDTSIWVWHLRQGHSRLQELLQLSEVVCHPFIIGELACGNIKNRDEIISLIQSLPMLDVIGHEEFLHFIENRQLMGKGLGFVDIHLIASAILANIPLWTMDKKLKQVSTLLNVNFIES
jgi:predicted nucleic acid-binding protein